MSSSKQVLLIFCDGGFGNRLNTLVSGLALARLCNLQVQVYWPCNNWCQAAFADIFSADLPVSTLTLSALAGTLDDCISLLHDQLGADTLKLPFASAYAYASLEDFQQRAVATGKRIFYYPALIPPWLHNAGIADAICQCTFQEPIRAAASTFITQTLKNPFHGLHLRRTDLNVGYTDAEVQDLVRRYPDEVFFVCSDDPLAEALAAVHPHVHQRPKGAYVGKRNYNNDWMALTADDDGRLYHGNIDRNAESVIEAVIDMLILAHSSIVGYSGSTFQNMARLIGECAPIVPLAKPQNTIDYLCISTATRMVRASTLPLGDCVTHGISLYNAGRKHDAIALQKAAIEHGSVEGVRDVNFFVLHYNLGAHLMNEGLALEASFYLEHALPLYPGHPQAAALLAQAQQRAHIEPLAQPSPTLGRTRIIDTYMQWHLGDNLIHLHFLRKLSEKYPEIQFRHALQSGYISQCRELTQDMPNITLVPLLENQKQSGLDGWKGAGGFFFSHPKKLQFGTLYLDLFYKLSKDMGLSTPFRTTVDLLFDYPAILEKQPTGRYDVVLINSKPLSDQFKTYSEKDFVDFAHTLRDKGLSVVTSHPIDGFDCTLDTQCTVTDIAALSLHAKYFIAVCTGAMWPCINVFNQDSHQFKIILNDHEIVDIGKNILMCTDTKHLKGLVTAHL